MKLTARQTISHANLIRRSFCECASAVVIAFNYNTDYTDNSLLNSKFTVVVEINFKQGAYLSVLFRHARLP